MKDSMVQAKHPAQINLTTVNESQVEKAVNTEAEIKIEVEGDGEHQDIMGVGDRVASTSGTGTGGSSACLLSCTSVDAFLTKTVFWSLLLMCSIKFLVLLTEWLTVFMSNRLNTHHNVTGVSEYFGIVSIVGQMVLVYVLYRHPRLPTMELGNCCCGCLRTVWDGTSIKRLLAFETLITIVGEALRLAPAIFDGVDNCHRSDTPSSRQTSMGKRGGVMFGCKDRRLLKTGIGCVFIVTVFCWLILLKYIHRLHALADEDAAPEFALEVVDGKQEKVSRLGVVIHSGDEEDKDVKY